MQELLHAIYQSLHIRALLKKADNFERNFSLLNKTLCPGLGKVAHYHVQAISETYQQLQIVNRIAVVPKDFPAFLKRF